jgi:maltose/moltooligosaccharide transporter
LEPISERLGRVKTHTLSISIMALGYFGIAQFATSPLTLYLLMAIVGIGWGAIVSLPFAIMSVRINQGQMGLFMGLFNLSVVLPQLVTSLGIGLMISRADDKSIVFIISAISIALSALCWARIKDQQDQPGSEAKFSSGH